MVAGSQVFRMYCVPLCVLLHSLEINNLLLKVIYIIACSLDMFSIQTVV